MRQLQKSGWLLFDAFADCCHSTEIPHSQEYVGFSQMAAVTKIIQKSPQPLVLQAPLMFKLYKLHVFISFFLLAFFNCIPLQAASANPPSHIEEEIPAENKIF